jgi:hypothetical protein
MELPIPSQVAERLRGRGFASFDEFRPALWQAVAAVPELARQFSSANLAHMRRGLPPKAPPSQQVPGSAVCHLLILDRDNPYNLDQLRIISPLRHYQIIHYGGMPFAQGDWNIDRKAIKERLVSIIQGLMGARQLTEEEVLSLIDEFEANAFYPSAADLIYNWPDEFIGPAELADFALGQEKIRELSRNELVVVARKLMSADITNPIESERLSMQLKANVPHPEGTG